MGLRAFDRKFGADRLREVPTTPGVYLFRDDAGRVVYVGKAKNLRRRLASYRSATRAKVHRKQRAIVRQAHALEVRPLADERAALLEEDRLIKRLRPPLNVDGAFAFLYPALGLGRDGATTLLAISTSPERWDALGLAWHGAFRSRPRAVAAFEALVEVLGRLGHREPPARLPDRPRIRGARLVGLRRLPPGLVDDLGAFLAGRGAAFPRAAALALLDKPAARRDAAAVQAHLEVLRDFHASDCVPLRAALDRTGHPGTLVPRAERDALFIRAAAG